MRNVSLKMIKHESRSGAKDSLEVPKKVSGDSDFGRKGKGSEGMWYVLEKCRISIPPSTDGIHPRYLAGTRRVELRSVEMKRRGSIPFNIRREERTMGS